MGWLVALEAPRQVALREYDDPCPGPTEVRVRTLYSGISAGTELTAYRGSNPYLGKRWDAARRLFVDGSPAHPYPWEGPGYESVGEVIELGSEVTGLRVGDRIWGAWGHRSSAVIPAEGAAERRLPEGMDAIRGVFARIGAIALNGVLDADVHVGEHVAVFGLGVPGLIATRLAVLSGARVAAVDRIGRRLELAGVMGAADVIDGRREPAAETIKELTGGRGADVTIEFTGSYHALQQAIRATAYSSRVVVCGFFQGEAVGLGLGEEFHHNRVELVCSQISGVAPRLAHRWTRSRLEATVCALQADARLDLGGLISHVVPFREAASAYQLLDEHPEDAVQVVLQF